MGKVPVPSTPIRPSPFSKRLKGLSTGNPSEPQIWDFGVMSLQKPKADGPAPKFKFGLFVGGGYKISKFRPQQNMAVKTSTSPGSAHGTHLRLFLRETKIVDF